MSSGNNWPWTNNKVGHGVIFSEFKIVGTFGRFKSVDKYKVSRICALCQKYRKIHQFGDPFSTGALS